MHDASSTAVTTDAVIQRHFSQSESMVKKVKASQSTKTTGGTYEDRKSAQMARDWAS